MIMYEGYFNDKDVNDDLVSDIEQTSLNNLSNTVELRFICDMFGVYPNSLEEFQKKLKVSLYRLYSIFNSLYNVDENISYRFYTYDSNTDDFVDVDYKDNDCSVLFNNSNIVNSSRTLFADFKLLLNEPFTVKTLDILCKRLFSTATINNALKLYIFKSMGINGKNISLSKYFKKNDQPLLFFPEMCEFVSGALPIEEHPIEQVIKYYKYDIGYLMKHYMETLASLVKKVTIPKKLKYNQVYLFNNYPISHNQEQQAKYGWCSLSLDTEAYRDKTECDYFCKMSESQIEEVCLKAADYVIKNSQETSIMLVNRYQCMQDRPTGLCYVFDKTFVYDDEEYIVVLMLGYETEVGKYKITDDKALNIIDVLLKDFNMTERQAKNWLVSEEIIYGDIVYEK